MIIQTDALQKTYGRHNALRGLNLSVPEGAALALIGANGAGKSTAIKVMMNILAPSGGYGIGPRSGLKTTFGP